ncbi:MAG: hypothetical protein J6N45_06565 [Alphaproteobacteria bacterium]|nr:hypothetical protein [Alphaproteobacteria bacterium]
MSEIQQLINRYREVIKSQQIHELANNYISQASHISELRAEQINEIRNKYLDLLVRTENEMMRLGIVKSRRQLSTLLLQDATQLNNIIHHRTMPTLHTLQKINYNILNFINLLQETACQSPYFEKQSIKNHLLQLADKFNSLYQEANMKYYRLYNAI